MIPLKPAYILHRSAAVIFTERHSNFSLFSSFKSSVSTKTKNNILDLLLNMPKHKTTAELKQQRSKKKTFASKYSASTITLQVLGSGAYGSPSSLYVFTDQTRYLFNCGEGTQRLAHEHKMKLSKLEHIFITTKTWNKIGGLPGVALTIQDIGVPSITLHGPPGLEKLFEATRRFVILNDLRVNVASVDEDSGFEDNVLNIDYVPITGKRSDEEKSSESDENIVDEDTTEYYGSVGGFKRHLEITHETNDAKKTKIDSSEAGKASRLASDTVLCYICRPKKKEGTLIIDKCVEKGVPPGPLLGRLKSGEDVTLPNGTIVKADEVRSPDCPGPVFIVVDCPDEKYLDSLVDNQKFAKHQKDATEHESAHVVVHFTPSHIIQNPKYKMWMEKFRVSTTHLLLNDLCSGMGSVAVHRIQYKLNLLDSAMFPLLKEDNPRFLNSEDNSSNEYEIAMAKKKLQINIPVPIILGETLLKYHLRPGMGQDMTSVVTLNPEEYINETIKMEGFQSQLESLQSKLSTLPLAENNNGSLGDYPELLFLGTGSCIPNKTRNTSGVLIRVDSTSCILMDCGEGTCGQILRFFGKENGQRILSQLKAIYVSHLHADHHLGLVNLLQERKRALEQLQQPFSPVLLLAPQQISPWLHLYHHQFEKIKPLFELIALANIILNCNSLEPSFYREKVLEPLRMSRVESIGVKHCPNAYGIAFTHQDGWKITYSGDTMPCDNLVLLGENSDVLIHEATMEDELKHEAVIKQHSTTSEAIEIGQRMKAKFVLLTHFSQRYAKVPIINEQFDDNVGIAFDNMSVRLKNLRRIPLFYPALKCMFADHCEEMEFKTQKKLKNRELELKA